MMMKLIISVAHSRLLDINTSENCQCSEGTGKEVHTGECAGTAAAARLGRSVLKVTI